MIGATLPAASLAARTNYVWGGPSVLAQRPAQPVAISNAHVVATESLNPPPTVPASQSAASAPSPAPSSASVAPSSLPELISGMVDPATGITYSGYLTPDAQTLNQQGLLVVSGNKLTAQGSALAAQGDLITGTPAPSTAQVAAASALNTTISPASDPWTEISNWLSSETYVSGIPNGALAAGAVILGSLFFGKKKGRR